MIIRKRSAQENGPAYREGNRAQLLGLHFDQTSISLAAGGRYNRLSPEPFGANLSGPGRGGVRRSSELAPPLLSGFQGRSSSSLGRREGRAVGKS